MPTTPWSVKQAVLFSQIDQSLSSKSWTILLGKKGTCKAELIDAYLKTQKLALYVNLENFDLVPETFALGLISKLHHNNFPDLPSLQQAPKSAKLAEILAILQNELQKIAPDQQLMLTTSFKYLNQYASEKGQRMLVCFSEIQELLKLNNYKRINDIVLLLTALQLPSLKILGTSSTPTPVRRAFSTASFVFADSLTEQEWKTWMQQSKIPFAATSYALTSGIPRYLSIVLSSRQEGESFDAAFSRQLADPHSLLHQTAKYHLDYYLDLARGQGLLLSIMRALSFSPNLRLTELARKIYRPAPITKSLVERLMEVDLLIKDNNRYRIADPVFAALLTIPTPEEVTFHHA